MTAAAEFRRAIRHGKRAGRQRLVAHAHRAEPAGSGPRVGFVVGRAVGGAVVRHRVQRRLRHLVADRLDRLEPGTLVVIRALPPAASATSAELAADLDSALRRLDIRTVAPSPANSVSPTSPTSQGDAAVRHG